MPYVIVLILLAVVGRVGMPEGDMKKPKRITKAKASQAPRRPKPRLSKRRKRRITAAEARRRAGQHVLKRLFQGATVRDGSEVGGNLYSVRREDTWVVYLNLRGGALRSSDVVVVCKRTGKVLAEGSAHDEG